MSMGGDYPTSAELRRIKNWTKHKNESWEDGWHRLMAFIEPYWVHYGRFDRRGRRYTLATGGWSGNESIISALHQNFLFWGLNWYMSKAGGLHVFKIRRILKDKKK